MKAEREEAFDQEAALEDDVAKWVEEDYLFDDQIVEAATTSISSGSPWLFYEPGIICARSPEGDLRKNSSGEKVINLRGNRE